MKIRTKVITLSSCSLLAALGLILAASYSQSAKDAEWLSNETQRMLYANGETLLKAKASQSALDLESSISTSLLIATALSDQTVDLRKSWIQDKADPAQLRLDIVQAITTTFRRNSSIQGIGVLFERDALDNRDGDFINDTAHSSNDAGRFISYISRAQGKERLVSFSELDIQRQDPGPSGEPYNRWYTCPREAQKPCLLNPYIDLISDQTTLMTTVSVPIIDGGVVLGVVGVDLALDTLQETAVQAQNTLKFRNSDVTFVASDGAIAADARHPDMLGKFWSTSSPESLSQVTTQPMTTDYQGGIRIYYPIQPLEHNPPWHVIITVPRQDLLGEAISLQNSLDDRQQSGRLYFLMVSVGACLLATVLMWMLAPRITRPIFRVAGVLEGIAAGDGDLTQRLRHDNEDELSHLTNGFNRLLDVLQPAIAQIKSNADAVRASADRSCEVSRSTSEGTLQQAREIDQVATAFSEMSASAQEVAANAGLAAIAAREAENSTSEAFSTIRRGAEEINGLADEISDSVKEVQELSKNSESIGSVLRVIREIAEQTNLLALNAAIEAARAGDSGRGFAVVADEVRSLSQRTQHSVEEIRQVIERLQTGTRNVAESMNSTKIKTGDTVNRIAKAEDCLGGIRRAATVMTEMTIQIASAAAQQSQVADELTQNIVAMRTLTEDIANHAHQAATFGEGVNELAGKQIMLMDKFRV